MSDDKPDPTPPPPADKPRRDPIAEAFARSGKDRPPRERPPFRPGKPDPLPIEPYSTGGGAFKPNKRQLDAAIEAEMEAALSGLSDKDLMPEPLQRRGPQPAKGPKPLLKGKVVSVHGKDVFVDVPGGRGNGVISLLQFEEGRPEVGSEVEFQIERYDDSQGLLVLSRQGAAQQVDWSSVERGMTVEARVTGVNKGGLSVEVNNIKGFLPISQIEAFRVERPEEYVNQRLKCMVTEANPEERNLVVSRRALLEREREELREQFWAEVAEGQEYSGIVRTVKPFGFFVDLGGADGLVPVGEMSWARVADPSQLVQPGQKVRVKVIRLDRDARKVTLSLRQLQASPWELAAGKYFPREVYAGKVTRLAEYGAFVELEPGVEGLVHVSELAPQRVRRPHDLFKEGQEVTVMVLDVDTAGRRMSLSIKAAQMKEAAPAEEEDEDEPEVPAKPPRPRNFQLRGGVGGGGPLFPPPKG